MWCLKRLKFVVAGLLLGAIIASAGVQTPGSASDSAFAPISVADLPRQGARTYGLIQQGGPFPHEKDGLVFANRERLLPARNRGYYREYTVMTPGSRDRGARRIVCGGQTKAPDICFYSDDHYASFRKIVH
jgi:ribonuclease T1